MGCATVNLIQWKMISTTSARRISAGRTSFAGLSGVAFTAHTTAIKTRVPGVDGALP